MLLFFWFVGLALIIVQSAILPLLFSPLYVPDIFFIFIAYSAYRFSWASGSLLIFALAWLFDTVASVHLGLYPVESILIFSFLKFVMTNTSVQVIFYQLPLVGLSYFVWRLVIYSLLGATASGGGIVSGTILVLLAAPLTFFLLDFLYTGFDKRRRWQTKPRRVKPRRLR